LQLPLLPGCCGLGTTLRCCGPDQRVLLLLLLPLHLTQQLLPSHHLCYSLPRQHPAHLVLLLPLLPLGPLLLLH
jgi:hypothetical protein